MLLFFSPRYLSSFVLNLIPLPSKCVVLFLIRQGFLFSHLLPSYVAQPAGLVVWIQPNEVQICQESSQFN